MVISITKHNFKPEIEESAKPVIIEAYATWCGPCQHMMPIFEDLEKELGSKYTFAKLNVDESSDIAMQYNILNIPSFVFIKDNELIGKESGYMSKDELKEKIEKILG